MISLSEIEKSQGKALFNTNQSPRVYNDWYHLSTQQINIFLAVN